VANPTLQIIVASTRPGRVGLPVAEWFHGRARAGGQFEIDLVDLAKLRLPFVDEPHHPRHRRYQNQHTRDWSARVEQASAFAFVTPEYNHGFSAPLKNALDFLHDEWAYKPVGFVSYGGVAAGTRAVQMLKQVVISVRMVPVPDSVPIPSVGKLIDGDGRLRVTEAMEQAAKGMLAELARLEAALSPLRS
jgi:NAD(P)H-dependent FMN reductase